VTNVNKWVGPYTKDSSLVGNRLPAYHDSNSSMYNQNALNRTNIVWWAVCREYHYPSWQPMREVTPSWWAAGICPQCEAKLTWFHGNKANRVSGNLDDICHCSSEILFNFGCQCHGK